MAMLSEGEAQKVRNIDKRLREREVEEERCSGKEKLGKGDTQRKKSSKGDAQ